MVLGIFIQSLDQKKSMVAVSDIVKNGSATPIPEAKKNFVLRNADAKAGRPTTIYHFNGSLGSPILNQDNTEDLYFFEITDDSYS